jgi:predicted  nucleic acid-binding Zn-ribbon protein
MIPEISHRCPSCGASVRDFGERAMFCPECGKNLTETTSEKPLHEDSQVATESAARSGADETTVVSAEEAAPVKATVTEGDAAKNLVVEDRHTARERTRETLHRASNMARGAIEDNVKRVEKIHHVSTVMLEEATYDPSLRFVLVALGLFVVFVILLVLSKVMG